MKPLQNGAASNPSAVGREAGIYTDLNGLQKIKQMNRQEGGDSDASLKAMASQFESIFVSMMMKSMREANAAFKDESMNNSNEVQFYEQMFDQQLALSLSSGGGIGLSQALVRQLKNSLHSENSEQGIERKAVTLNPFADYRDGVVPSSFGVRHRSEIDASEATPRDSLVVSDFTGQQEFIERMMPLAEKAARDIGVDPRYLLSQAALETGWGRHLITDSEGRNSHNLFGIKAGSHWQGDVAVVDTLEYRDGLPLRERASFRAYDSYADSFNDFVQFVSQQPRYARALREAVDGEQFVKQLQQAGYATDPQYASKIINIVQRNLSVAAEDDRG